MKSTNLLSIGGTNSTKLDEKETTIVRVLLIEEGLRFTEFFEKTKNRFDMDKKTFIGRLRKLQNQGYIKHKKGIYYLVAKKRRVQYRNLIKTLNKFRKEFEKKQGIEFLFEKLMLMDKIFKEIYLKVQYERLCFWSEYTKGEQLKIKDIISKCEKIIIEIADDAKIGFPEPGNILPPYEVISIKKVSKA